MRSGAHLPSLGRIQSALRKTTEALAIELALPGSSTPDWSEFEWQIARAVAATHGVSPLLASTLRWRVPADWRAFLEQQRENTIIRHGRIESLLSQIDALSRAQALPLVALKGAALHRAGLYRAGERPMADLDLLVRPADVVQASAVLGKLGYHQSQITPKHRVFTRHDPVNPPRDVGEHPDNPLKIELHESLREWLPLDPQDITSTVWPHQATPGLNPYPTRAALMAHLLLHASGALAYRCVRLLHLNDIALVSRSMGEADWQQLCGPDRRCAWWALPPLLLTTRYYEAAVPHAVLESLAARCPKWLRSRSQRQVLAQVSLSNLRIEAFPGIEWARTPSEGFRYVMSRIRPSRETLVLRKYVAATQPHCSAGNWSQLSQGRRILKWLLSRPTRSESLYPVQMVLMRAR